MNQREEIVVRAEQLFMRLGVRSVTMDDVSRELGISKKTIYQHFENKDALLEAVISTHVSRERTVMDSISAKAKDALDEVITIGTFMASTIEDVSASTLFDLQKYYHKLWELLMNKQDCHMIDTIVRNIERGKEEGLYRQEVNPEIISRIYAKATYMIVEELANPSSKFSRKELIRELHNYHIHAITTQKGIKKWYAYLAEAKV